MTVSAANGSWPAEPASVPAARRLVRGHLDAQGLSVLSDDAELLVSELVGNVVLHVGGTVTVSVRGHDDEVLLEVGDASATAPQLRMFSETSSTGRGIRLVQSLSTECGVRPTPAGKVVWARLTIATASRGDDELADGFAGVDWLAELARLDDDAGDSRVARGTGAVSAA